VTVPDEVYEYAMRDGQEGADDLASEGLEEMYKRSSDPPFETCSDKTRNCVCRLLEEAVPEACISSGRDGESDLVVYRHGAVYEGPVITLDFLKRGPGGTARAPGSGGGIYTP
jgi:hypothetical protein